MKVLVGCEESGVVRRAFRGRGHDAWSCDLEYDADDGSKYHIRGDVMDALTAQRWDLIILHPPCDYLAVSGNRWYGVGMRDHQMRLDSIEWTCNLWMAATDLCQYVALENPVGVILPNLPGRPPVQYIQPHMFGHPEFKNTGLALHGLPPLRPTDQLKVPKAGTQEHTEWQKVWRMPPGPERKKMRSRTYLGIADAMASQWSTWMAEQRAIEIIGGMAG